MAESKNKYKIIFFDLGNVLINFNIELFFANLSILTQTCMIDIYSLVDSHSKTIEQFNKGRLSTEDFYITVTKSLNNISFEQFKKAYTEIFSLNKSILPVINALKNEIDLSIISNTDPLHYQYLKEEFDILSQFNNPITSFEVKALKPEKEIYNIALQKFNILPQESIFIDDKIENINAANDLGMTGIHYNSAPQLIQSLYSLGFTNLKIQED